jgi:phospho-N-acetylmuramoyl-pentapeptide-transferase
MGGVTIILAAVAGYLATHIDATFTTRGLVAMFAVCATALLGLVDDGIKVHRQRSLGLNKRAKVAGQLVVAVTFAVLCVTWLKVDTHLSFTRWNTPGWELGDLGWCVWAVLLIYATTNGVNLSDGLDGLAAGSAIFPFSCLIVVGFWALRHFDTYQINHALDLAVVAAAMMGACAGFLWWNAAPARIFMGDTGALAIGAGVASLVLTLNVQLLLPVFGLLYVAETFSVILQVGSFRLFKRRIFRMAPIHHHFELGGWPETTIIIRFWLLAGASAALALGLFYADFIGTGGLD